MIYVIQRLFGKSDKKDFYNTSETAIRDLIKVLVMGCHRDNANKHWIEVAASSILDQKRSPNRPRICSFLGVSSKREQSTIRGFDSMVKDIDESPEEFVERLWNEVALQKKNGVLKYPHMMSPSPTKEQISETLEKLRFIALSLTGQEKAENFGWDGKSLRTNINFGSTRIDSMTVPVLCKELEGVFGFLCPGIEIK